MAIRLTMTVAEVGVLSPERVAAIAKDSLNEDPARVKNDIKAIKEWIKKQPHLHKNVNTDDDHILVFLRGCKFSLERTKEKLDLFYTVRAACPDWFSWDPKDPNLKGLLQTGSNLPLKGYDKHGRKVLLLRAGNFDPTKFDIVDQVRLSFMIAELSFHTADQSSVTGFVIIQDMSAMTMTHLTQFSPAIGKKSITIWQDAYPRSPKGMHMLNMPGFAETLFRLMQGFMKDKMKNRMVVHSKGDLSALHEAVGTHVLPAEYGGSNGSIKDHVDHLELELEKKRKWLIEQCKYKADEKKRPGKSKTYSDIFGMEGSFRQLEID